MDPSRITFEPDLLMRTLVAADVRFVMIGGMTALLLSRSILRAIRSALRR
jgi:hypothetical protein